MRGCYLPGLVGRPLGYLNYLLGTLLAVVLGGEVLESPSLLAFGISLAHAAA